LKFFVKIYLAAKKIQDIEALSKLQYFSFERATLDLTGKTVPLAGFSEANFKSNRL
jgi:hypothetical protein